MQDFVGMDALRQYSKKVVRIRPYPIRLVNPDELTELGCDATEFYELHPDDVEIRTARGVWVCAHEILTD